MNFSKALLNSIFVRRIIHHSQTYVGWKRFMEISKSFVIVIDDDDFDLPNGLTN